MLKVLGLAGAALMLAGCVTSYGRQLDTASLKQAYDAKTTCDSMIMSLGRPTADVRPENNFRTVFYTFNISGSRSERVLPLAGPFLGDVYGQTDMLVMQCNTDGVMVGYQYGRDWDVLNGRLAKVE